MQKKWVDFSVLTKVHKAPNNNNFLTEELSF